MDPTKAPAVDPAVLFSDYYHWRGYTAVGQTKRAGCPRLTPKTLQPFVALSAWCAEQVLHAREWLFTLFAARRWLYWPPPAQLRSAAHLKRVRSGERWPTDLYRERVLAEVGKSDVQRAFDPNVEISETVEEAKRYYLRANDAQACMAVMRVETFGFHPRSTVCARCPGAATCRDLLGKVAPATVAVREGADVQRVRHSALLRGVNQVGSFNTR